jgi:hypothetical protein
MPSQISQPASFAITGHGRSGTSLVAAMLQSAGLDIGERLMGPGEANKHGHFEDLDFYEFHVSVLRAQGFHDTGFILEPSVSVPDSFADRARSLVQERMRAGRPWGWKEPRTTLFLDFWHHLIPKLHCIFLFRAPWEVVDSLFRRGDVNYLNNPNMAVRVWLNYNRAVLAFQNRHPERCLLVESYAVAQDPSCLIEAIARKFGHHFGPIGDLYDEKIYSHHTSSQHQSVLAHWFPETLELYEELRGKAEVAGPQELLPQPAASASAVNDWALQHWVDWRAAERQLKQCQSERERKGAELQQLQAAASQPCAPCQHADAELHTLRAQTKQFHEELEQTRQQARQTRADHQQADAQRNELRTQAEQLRNDLKQTRQQAQAAHEQADAELHNLRAQMERLRDELERARKQMQQAQTQIACMESSRFWKLRHWWQRLRHPFNGQPHPAE